MTAPTLAPPTVERSTVERSTVERSTVEHSTVDPSTVGADLSRPCFDHLLSLSNRYGTFEHADHIEPRLSHGYCSDDVARVLVVVARQPRPSPAVRNLGHTALRFLADAQDPTGRIRNRRRADGRWQGRYGVEDCWGRSLWAFGTAACRAPEDWMAQSALAYFDHGAQQRSPWPRAMAFAALGAAEVLASDRHHLAARSLLVDTVTTIGPRSLDEAWPWPEPRLTYANAVLPEALLAAGHGLDRVDVVDHGLALLRWLLDRETVDGHLSPTPVGGAGPLDHRSAFDQQPIEVAAMADACARAAAITGDAGWVLGVELAARWFLGHNDAGALMIDGQTGGGYDGLEATGPNLNEGAESSLAVLSTLQQALRLAPA